MAYTNEEAFQMLIILGECFQNFRAAERMYSERFPNAPVQSRKSFERLSQRLRRTGNVHPPETRIRNRTVRDENAPDILAAVELNPQVSSRDLAKDSGISHRSVLNIMKDNKLHPFHISLHQQLDNDDFMRRTNYCIWIQNEIARDHNFPHNVLWSDEATFKSDGNVNRHNMHYWSLENPHWFREVSK